MKTMILTGLATEQSFASSGPAYYLVFNDGELRVPVTEAAAEVVVQAMYASNGASNGIVSGYQTEDGPDPSDEDVLHQDRDVVDEIGIPQA